MKDNDTTRALQIEEKCRELGEERTEEMKSQFVSDDCAQELAEKHFVETRRQEIHNTTPNLETKLNRKIRLAARQKRNMR